MIDIGFLFKNCGKFVDSLLLPGVVLGIELRDPRFAFERVECYFRFELRAVAVAGRLAHHSSSFFKVEPSIISCPVRWDLLPSLTKRSPASRSMM